MRHPLATISNIIDAREEESQREHLRTLWMLADFLPVLFVSIDLEGPFVSTISPPPFCDPSNPWHNLPWDNILSPPILPSPILPPVILSPPLA